MLEKSSKMYIGTTLTKKNVGLLYVGTVFFYFDEKNVKKCIQAGIVYKYVR